MPELQALRIGAVASLVLFLVGIGLEFALIQLEAVVEEELVRGLHTGLNAVLDHCAGSRRTGQLLDFHPEEGDAGEQVHRGLQVL